MFRVMHQGVGKRSEGVMTPDTILSLIKSSPQESKHKIIVMGRVGPTGKSYLTEQLRSAGYDAVEISEMTAGLVDYPDFENHYICDLDSKTTIIILNHYLKQF